MEKWATDLYWWERPEDVHTITERVERLLQSLAGIDPWLSAWQLPPRLNSSSRTMIPFDGEYFERVELEQDGRTRRDDNSVIIEESGFYASILTPHAPGTD